MKAINYLLKLVWVSITIFCYFTTISIILEKIEHHHVLHVGFPWVFFHQFILDDSMNHGSNIYHLFYDFYLALGIAIIYLEIKRRLKK